MAIPKQQEQLHQLSTQQEPNTSFLLDALYCEEERWEDESEEEVLQGECSFAATIKNSTVPSHLLFPVSLFEHDLFWEDEELLSLFSKEQEQQTYASVDNVAKDPCLSRARREAVEWMLKVNAHYAFSALTSILAINFLDRFLVSPCYQRDNNKPWMIQLVAVTCLSLAAKVEETRVPLLLDLQVGVIKYVFEAKTIQRMELLVLSTLKWKMHPVTPLSFLDHIVRRLGLKTHVHWEFRRRCESLLLSLVSDSRSVNYLPSVLATATMMHVIDQVETLNPIDYQNQLLGVLNITKEKVNGCYGLILELSRTQTPTAKKRKVEPMPSSPSGVIDAVFSCDSSNDSWTLQGLSVSSSPEPPFKKSRTQDQWVFVDIVGSPR